MNRSRELRDELVAADIREALGGHGDLNGARLSVAVRGGVAHVDGALTSREQRVRLRDRISRVRGINAVWDSVTVEGEDGLRILDIGCGNYKQKSSSYGVDRYGLRGVNVITDLEHGLPFATDSVDQVYAVHSLEHVQNLIGLMNEIHRVLVPDGVLHVMVPNFSCVNAIADPTHLRFFHPQTFKMFCLEHPAVRRFRPLSIAATNDDVFADLQPAKDGRAEDCERLIARFFD